VSLDPFPEAMPHIAEIPQSTSNSAPVTNFASSEAR
jgi:hypothetical protein